MPDDRFLHPRLRMSAKVSALSDFEYRVWTDYLLVADNFGVLPYSGAMLRAGNTAIATRPEAAVMAALDVLVKVELLLTFDHQGQRYLCDPVWQDFQKIRYPSRTYYPAPGPEVFGNLSATTQKFFRRLHPMFRKVSRTQSRPVDRLTANGKRLEAGGGAGEGSTFEAFYRRYPRHVGRDAAERAWRAASRRAEPAEILAGLERQHAELSKREPKYIPHPATWLTQGRWKDEVVAPAPPHRPNHSTLCECHRCDAFRKAKVTHA